MIKCRKFTLLRIASSAESLSHSLAHPDSLFILQKCAAMAGWSGEEPRGKLMEKMWHFTLCFLSFACVLSGDAVIFIWILGAVLRGGFADLMKRINLDLVDELLHCCFMLDLRSLSSEGATPISKASAAAD